VSVSFNTDRSESPKIGTMRIGIGLPAAVPGADMARIGAFAARADAVADAYLEHYYGPDYFAPARSDTLTSAGGVRAELARLAGAGCTDVVLYPRSGDPDQIGMLSQALRSAATVPDA
jgi:hypothetical protein